MTKEKYSCDKCGKSYFIGSPSRGQDYAGIGQCPECERILCSNCYVQGTIEKFGIMMVLNLCPECKVALEPPHEGKRSGNTDKSGCFIATAVFENPEAPEVITLRVLRDGVLSKSIAGRLLVRTYYALSPRVARLISRSERIKSIARRILRPIVNYLGYRE